MSILKSIAIAFAMFSKIPMPQFEWKEKDMRYFMLSFPLVGLVIGGCEIGWFFLCKEYSIPRITYTCIGLALPVLLTGGIHLDGYMDVMDAIHSYQSKERKLEILKDPHIGAFAVIYLIVLMLLSVGAFWNLKEAVQIEVMACGYVYARILSAGLVLCLPCAKKDGLAYTFSEASAKRKSRVILCIELVICLVVAGYLSLWRSLAFVVTGILFILYYQYQCKKEFGGITGDTAGYFVTVLELLLLVICVC